MSVVGASVVSVVANQLKAAHESTIRQNSVSLAFLRQTRHREGGGFSSWAEDPQGGFGPYSCCVAWQNIGGPQEVGGDAGLQQRDQTWVLATMAEVPFRVQDNDSNTARIETTHPMYGRMRLSNIKPLAYGEIIWGWQAKLEAIR